MKNLVALATFATCFKMYRGFLMFVEYQKKSTLSIPKNSWLNKVDIKNLSQGIYLIAVYSEDKKSVKKMIVK
jgi:hypothetical protein